MYGCHLGSDTPGGPLTHIKRIVTFTEKTRYIFEIQKGLDPADALSNPGLVNKLVPLERRRVPLRHMIYVGDGLTDIPCFSLMKQNGGKGFGVFDKDLGSILRAAILNRCSDIQLDREQPRREPK